MFHTNVYKTVHNHDMEISRRRGYENKIDRLQSDLHKSVTPEQLTLGSNIEREYLDSIAATHCQADNSIADFICLESAMHPHDIAVHFNLNNTPLTVSVPKFRNFRPCDAGKIRDSIVNAVSCEISKHIFVAVVDDVLRANIPERTDR